MANVKFPDTAVQVLKFESVSHMVPNYLAFYVLSDSIVKPFPGRCQHAGVLLGPGSYVAKEHEQLPFIHDLDDKQHFEWALDEMHYTEEHAIVDVEFHEELEPSKEYSVELWTRWLYDFPHRLLSQDEYHSLFRLTTQQKHSDYARPGDRVLAAWVGRQYYLFSTYDRNNPKVSTNINYQFNLEGFWNYVSFSYKANTATAFVLFSRDNDKVASTITDIDHLPITDYARLLVAPKEFAYSPFHGIVANVKFAIGKVFHQPQNIPFHPVIQEPSDLVQLENHDPDQDYHLDQFPFASQYSVSTWLKLKVK